MALCLAFTASSDWGKSSGLLRSHHQTKMLHNGQFDNWTSIWLQSRSKLLKSSMNFFNISVQKMYTETKTYKYSVFEDSLFGVCMQRNIMSILQHLTLMKIDSIRISF